MYKKERFRHTMPGTSKNAARVIDQDEEDYREIITRKLIPDLINFDNVMPNSTMNTVFMSRGSMTRIGTAEQIGRAHV